MALMIELSFIRERTKKGLQRARNDGKRLGHRLRQDRALEAGRSTGRHQGVVHRHRYAEAPH
jgi:DNA invertase Pin-like site-specific DNA recombinase